MELSAVAPLPPPCKEADELEELLREATQVFSDYVRTSRSAQAPVIIAKTSGELDLTIPEEDGVGPAGIWNDVRTICGAATNTWSERFLYKLYASPTPIGVIGEALMGLLNNNAHVFQASPIGALLECQVGRRLAELAQFPADTAAGLTFPGGSYSNLHALMVARNRRFPELKRGGFAGAKLTRRPMVFTSAHAHYSIEKAAVAAGIGLDNVVSVPTDAAGRMDPHQLRVLVEQAVADGGAPFFVNATAGTTVLGAFDPIDAIADVCADHGLWLHVDGSWGGPLALFCAEDDSEAFGGGGCCVGRADSLTVNPHKLMGVPLQCSFLLLRDGLAPMREALGLGASYLFHNSQASQQQQQPTAAVDDVGDATLGCGRRPDAIKLWLAWRYHGSQHFRRRLRAARRLALAFAALVEARPPTALGSWRLAAQPQSTCVCFWFVPRHAESSELPQPAWGHATRQLCARLNAVGHVLVDYATADLPAGALPAFFRLPINSPHVALETLAGVLAAIEQAAQALLDESCWK
ncbi:Glutamate decarboxylase 2 [Coemansia sp. RSA 2424]|nr:Glutamate decarboxylase 2 [Coemansia sp. RSA 2424]